MYNYTLQSGPVVNRDLSFWHGHMIKTFHTNGVSINTHMCTVHARNTLQPISRHSLAIFITGLFTIAITWQLSAYKQTSSLLARLLTNTNTTYHHPQFTLFLTTHKNAQPKATQTCNLFFLNNKQDESGGTHARFSSYQRPWPLQMAAVPPRHQWTCR